MKLVLLLVIVTIIFSSCGTEKTEAKQESPEEVVPVEPLAIELYAKQFSWTVRYAGKDNQLGKADFKLITDKNPLGVITEETYRNSLIKLDSTIKFIEARLCEAKTAECAEFRRKYLNLDSNESIPVISIHEEQQLEHKMERLTKRKNALLQLERDSLGFDDVITYELHLPVNRKIKLHFRSQDVIHSAYMPHFRVQMNTVPGMTTHFLLTPIMTSVEMRKKPETIEMMAKINHKQDSLQQPHKEFDYILLCNKICGAGHSNMHIKVVVEEQEEFEEWMKNQPTFLTYQGEK
jgi:heme/copper-type cytochrome/quinol oxidase subunit 2